MGTTQVNLEEQTNAKDAQDRKVSPSEWKSRYSEIRGLHQKLTRKTEHLLQELLEEKGIRVAVLQARTKELDSFEDKVARPGKSYPNPLSDFTDLSGVRIVLYSLSDVESVAELINLEFDVDTDKSINKATQLGADRFGYLSQHYIVRVGERRKALPEWSDVSGLCCEIQVRTVLQHSWAAVEHVLVYKSEAEAPQSMRRRLSRLSALFELADEELDHLIEEREQQLSEYSKHINQDNSLVEINVDSLSAYVKESNELQFFLDYVEQLGFSFKDDENRDYSWLLKVTQICGYNSLNDIDRVLREAREWGPIFLKMDIAAFLKQKGLGKESVKFIPGSILGSLILGSKAEKITDKDIEGNFKPAIADRMIKHAKIARGLIKVKPTNPPK